MTDDFIYNIHRCKTMSEFKKEEMQINGNVTYIINDSKKKRKNLEKETVWLLEMRIIKTFFSY